MDEKEFKGVLGESLTELLLQKNIHVYKQIIRDLIIPAEDNKTTQIDNVLITAKGIFVIENKNLSGILKNDASGNWYSILNKETYPIRYNPILQNEYHIKCLQRLLNKDKNIFYSFIVLGYNSINEINVQTNSNVKVIKIDELEQEIVNLLLNIKENKLSHEEIDDIYLKLKYNNYIKCLKALFKLFSFIFLNL